MKPTVRAVIFDLDGTLANTLEDLADCVNRALAAYSLPVHPLEPYKYFVGMGGEHLIRSAAPEGTPPSLLAEIGACYKGEYAKGWAVKSRPYEGIADMLERLESMRVPMAVLSNKPQIFTGDFVRHFFPETPFAVVQGSPEGGVAKPDPAMALAIAKTLGLAPEVIAFVGDTRTDMETATNAGMRPVGVTWGFRPEKELLDFGARVLLSRPAAIFDNLLF